MSTLIVIVILLLAVGGGLALEVRHRSRLTRRSCGVEEPGRPRQSHKLEIAGSNPAPAPDLHRIDTPADLDALRRGGLL